MQEDGTDLAGALVRPCGAQAFAARTVRCALLSGPFNPTVVDLCRDATTRDRFPAIASRFWSTSEPMVVTETGCCTYRGAEDARGSGFDVIDLATRPSSPAGMSGTRRPRRPRSLTCWPSSTPPARTACSSAPWSSRSTRTTPGWLRRSCAAVTLARPRRGFRGAISGHGRRPGRKSSPDSRRCRVRCGRFVAFGRGRDQGHATLRWRGRVASA
jgi:hypothetical protein